MIKKPLLAGTVKDLSKIKYPIIASPKLDGIRCLIIDGKAVSRNFKEIPNKYIAKLLPTIASNGMDGELLLKSENGKSHQIPFNKVSSAVMSFDGEPDFEYHVFDMVEEPDFDYEIFDIVGDLPFGPDVEYKIRVDMLNGFLAINKNIKIKFVPIKIINNEQELNEYEQECVANGFEGVMIRSPKGKYKFGRSSEKEGILLKIKRFEDSEAKIIAFEEKQTNTNEKEKDAFGHSKRSSKKEGMVQAGTLGALKVRDIKTGQEFSIGSGFDDALRKDIWENQVKYKDILVKYKYQPAGGKDLPRFPVYIGFRHENDL